MSYLKNTVEYEAISKFYGDEKAKRSQIPLMNHIDEGIDILESISASEFAIRAYLLHPIFQGDLEWRSNISRCGEFDSHIMALVLEYRKCANSYLCKPYTDEYQLGDLKIFVNIISKDVRDMLYADKIQNRKDFNLYHKGSHARSGQLSKYFDLWIEYLNKWEDE